MLTRLENLDALEEYGAEFVRTLTPDATKATIVGLSGDLGSGKTAFTKTVARALGIVETVPSPTFVIAKYYDIREHPHWKRLIHIDAYRIEDNSELKPLKWDNLLSDPANLIIVEWPEKLEGAFPYDAPLINFRFLDETTRTLERVR